MKYFMAFLASLLLLTGCEEKIIEISETKDIKIDTKDIEVYSEIHLNDIITINKNVEIISDNYSINTEKIGKVENTIIYKLDNKKYSYKFHTNIVDTEPPRVFSGTNKTVVLGYTGELCDLITYGDNYDGYVNCLIDGAYDLNTVGTYNLTYNLSDSSDNLKQVNVTLNVKESNNKKTEVVHTKTLFSDVVSKYKNDNNEIGIDVSKWQGDIDFEKVKASGATFVMMRIGVQKRVLDDLEIDPYYLENIKKAKDAGLKVGVYLYSIATTKKEAVKHAKWVIKTLDKEELDLPIVFDWENWSKWNSYRISFHDINSIADSFMNTVKESGYEGMLYSSKFYLENIWENKSDFPIWLAHYTEKTSYEGKYIMWQLCNNGQIDGIKGDVDIDIMYR